MWLYCCVRLVISNMVYLYCDGTENAADRAYRRHKIPDWWLDGATIERSHPVGEGPKYLIRDRDKKYATHFSAVAMSSGIKELKTPFRTPQANGYCERFMGSLRRECMDHILFHDDNHLRGVVTEYTAYFNQERPHQGIDQRIPKHYDLPKSKPTRGPISSKVMLGGLHHSYSRTLLLN